MNELHGTHSGRPMSLQAILRGLHTELKKLDLLSDEAIRLQRAINHMSKVESDLEYLAWRRQHAQKATNSKTDQAGSFSRQKESGQVA